MEPGAGSHLIGGKFAVVKETGIQDHKSNQRVSSFGCEERGDSCSRLLIFPRDLARKREMDSQQHIPILSPCVHFGFNFQLE